MDVPYVAEALRIANANPKMTAYTAASIALGVRLQNLSRSFYRSNILMIGDAVRRLRND